MSIFICTDISIQPSFFIFIPVVYPCLSFFKHDTITVKPVSICTIFIFNLYDFLGNHFTFFIIIVITVFVFIPAIFLNFVFSICIILNFFCCRGTFRCLFIGNSCILCLFCDSALLFLCRCLHILRSRRILCFL